MLTGEPLPSMFSGGGAFGEYSGRGVSTMLDPAPSFGSFRRQQLLRRASASAPAQFGAEEDPTDLLSVHAAALSAQRSKYAGAAVAPAVAVNFGPAGSTPDVFRPGALLRNLQQASGGSGT